MQTTHIPGAWLSVIWIHFGGITQICSQANVAACDVRITQQPSPYIIDGSNSTMTLTCNVVGATEFTWAYNRSGQIHTMPCLHHIVTVNTCTYRPQRDTVNLQVRCRGVFENKAPENVYCTPNIQVAARDVRITQQPSPYIIDGSNSTMTLTCKVDGAIEFLWAYNRSGQFITMPCLRLFVTVNTCTYRPQRDTANLQVRCRGVFKNKAPESVYFTPNIQVAACDVRMTQQPSPFFIIDGSNSTMTLTCNVVGATEFYWNYKVSSGFLPCTENYNTVNTCTYRPQRDTANQEVMCRAAFPTNATTDNIILCTPNILCYCNATNTGNRKVFVSQQTAPFVIDGSDSPITLTCHAQNSTASTEYTWKDQTGVLKNCQETTHSSRTCTFPLDVGESQDPVTCSVVTAGATTESASCVPVVKIVTTKTNPTANAASTSTNESSRWPNKSTILGSAMAAVVALIVVIVIIWKRSEPAPQPDLQRRMSQFEVQRSPDLQRRMSRFEVQRFPEPQVQRFPEPQVTFTGQTYPLEQPDTNLEDSISLSETSSTGPYTDSDVDTDDP